MEETCEVIITAADADWLAEFTRRLVTDRLAACGHNIAVIRSIYRWEGNVQDEDEARVALHTRRALVPEIVARSHQEHPYEVPCVIALPILDGNPDYLRWIIEETREPAATAAQD
ncbi:divalent-cation tolerance protein CutA [Micromonospora sp. HM5-17]|jgi:periplasmic divalent cation tolerance protein|uniref:divalent-cation tolerance protein CutA n=1 Tax=Micromonospora sp. HM5-17 TaxID=2487710 RepID=UPI000F47F8B5|nr:divalent-cation tolerance protein CutA [Micromonospora sp. HM5-17]ROT34132.1 divalent-cation tolerance protein CutA [Micromonospora sp. HM5-17]